MIIDFSQVMVSVSCDYFKGSLSLYVLVSVSEALLVTSVLVLFHSLLQFCFPVHAALLLL